jgi:hypothetical protein
MGLGERKSPSSDSDILGLTLYVKPVSDARTPLGTRRVSARRGWAGEKSGFFSILLGSEPSQPTLSDLLRR